MKKNERENLLRLEHVLDSIERIKRFTHQISVNEFLKDEIIQQAVLMQFVIIGEAIGHIDSENLSFYPYQWYKAKAFRNLIAHEYFNVRIEAVWNTVQNDVPELEDAVKALVTRL